MGGVATMLTHIVSHILAIGHHALHEVFNIDAHVRSYLKIGQGGFEPPISGFQNRRGRPNSPTP